MTLRLGLAALAFSLALAACESTEQTAELPPPPPPPPEFGIFPELVDYAPNYPPGTCMSREEMMADQLAKLRTEMMVTGLTCPVPYSDPALFSRYASFTVAHQERLREGQNTIGSLLARHLGGNRARRFDTYLTEMANSESMVVTRVSTGGYCQARREQFDTVLGYSAAELTAYLEEAVERHRDDYDVCE